MLYIPKWSELHFYEKDDDYHYYLDINCVGRFMVCVNKISRKGCHPSRSTSIAKFDVIMGIILKGAKLLQRISNNKAISEMLMLTSLSTLHWTILQPWLKKTSQPLLIAHVSVRLGSVC